MSDPRTEPEHDGDPGTHPPTPEQTPHQPRPEKEPEGRSPGEAFPKDEDEGSMQGGAPTG